MGGPDYKQWPIRLKRSLFVAILSSLVSDKVPKDRIVAVAIHFLQSREIINKVYVCGMRAIFQSPVV